MTRKEEILMAALQYYAKGLHIDCELTWKGEPNFDRIIEIEDGEIAQKALMQVRAMTHEEEMIAKSVACGQTQ